ncbi:hypothetical protein ABDK00_000325 [Niabella insulamsoli]|uniref:hypothetical protein n=1 Tax=Niabella insulamsoli TaxID=3144874 RepID=UPI0031FE2543
MCYRYGIGICKDVLAYLKQNRFDEALSEMETMEPEDISSKHFEDLKGLLKKYYAGEDIFVEEQPQSGAQPDGNVLQQELKQLCFEILNYNRHNVDGTSLHQC